LNDRTGASPNILGARQQVLPLHEEFTFPSPRLTCRNGKSPKQALQIHGDRLMFSAAQAHDQRLSF
jgi:hypothetical protein